MKPDDVKVDCKARRTGRSARGSRVVAHPVSRTRKRNDVTPRNLELVSFCMLGDHDEVMHRHDGAIVNQLEPAPLFSIPDWRASNLFRQSQNRVIEFACARFTIAGDVRLTIRTTGYNAIFRREVVWS